MNPVVESAPVRGERAYVYAFKERARKHHCLGYGTFSVEVENLERLRKEYSRRTGPITYVPLYVKATALAVQQNPEANSILFRSLLGYRVVRFEQVDVNLPITRMLDGRPVTFIATIRDAPRKTLVRIQEEIAHHERCAPEDSFYIRRIRQFSRMTLWLARLVHARMMWDPAFYTGNVGTCGLTLAEGGCLEHGFPIGPTTAVFGIGGTRREPVVRGDAVVPARVLKATLMVDNYVVSGLTGAKLIRDFKELLEGGSFVREELDAAGSIMRGSAPESRPRVRLPVSSARGGTLPGVDLNDSAAVMDRMEDCFSNP